MKNLFEFLLLFSLLALVVCSTTLESLDNTVQLEGCQGNGTCKDPQQQDVENHVEEKDDHEDEDEDDDDEDEDDEDNDSGDDELFCQDGECLDMGEEQDFDIDPELTTECEERDEEAWEYLLTLAEDPDTPEEIRDALPRCRNNEPECTYWAVQGKCENDRFHSEVGDMLQDCSAACFSCEKLVYEHRCPLDPNAPSAWKPGDVNKFFQNVTTQEKYEKYKPKVWSRPSYAEGHTASTADYKLGPWIVTLEDVLSKEECDHLIKLGEEEGMARSDDWAEYINGEWVGHYHEGRTSWHSWCEKCGKDPISKGVLDRIEEITNIPQNFFADLQMLRYKEGQKYDVHTDYDGVDLERQVGVRIMTFFMYLNDVEEGGGTFFPRYNITFTPRCGRVALWPNVLDENPDELDPRTEHAALPPLNGGEKYSANAWIHQHDFKGADAVYCRE